MPTPTPTPTPTTTTGIGNSVTVTAPAVASGLYSGGPADPGTPAITTNASGRPNNLGYYGSPGTATLVQFMSGSGWILGRFGNGTFVTGGSSGTITYAANDGVHFAAQSPTTALPTSGGILYTVTAATQPTFVGGARTFDSPVTVINLGVAFGSAPKFGYDGTISGQVDGTTPASISFSTAGGSAVPSLTNSFINTGNLSLFGTAPVTVVTANLCASAAACRLDANFISGGAGAATFGVGYGLVGVTDNKSILNGAAILGAAGTIATTPTPQPPAPIAFDDVAGTRRTNQFVVRVDPKNAIASVGPATTVTDVNGLAAYRRNSSSAESPQRGTATGGEGGNADNVIFWTRWAGGTTAGDFNGSSPVTLGANQGMHFVYGAPATAIPTTGTATYILAGNTSPTIVDGSLTPGSFTGSAAVAFGSTARLGLDFTVTIGGVTYRSMTAGGATTPASSDITLSGGAFEYFGAGLPTTGTGVVCPNGTCRAGVIGALAGAAAAYLGFDYLIAEPTPAGLKTAVSGAAAFRLGTSNLPGSGSGPAPTGAGSYSAQGFGLNRSAIAGTTVATTAGQLASVATTSGTYARGTATDVDNGGVAGIVGWSRWAGGTVTAATSTIALTANQGIHNVWGAPLTNMPTTGTATYDLAGATKPTIGDGSLAPGTFTGSLAVSFATMKVGWESIIAIGGNSYTFSTAGGLASPSVTLGSDGRWIGSGLGTGSVGGRGYGFLAGSGASHAGMSYFITPGNGSDATNITGSAVFAKR